MKATVITAALALAIASPAAAQLGGLGKITDTAKKVDKGVKTVNDMVFTEAEEVQIGADISAKLRDKYGVVQDQAVHKYVTLVGKVLANSSSRPNLKWTFIVLDTDGINAFAAPGGFIHITRGALAMISNESELADVLGHEIGHVTEKHTIGAIQKSKGVSVAADATRSQILGAVAEQGYSMLLDNKFSRNEEIEADTDGMKVANSVGYAPGGLQSFLKKLAERNKDLKEPSGVFASHPDTQARLDSMAKVITGQKLTAANLVAARYTQHITYKPVPISAIPQVAPPSAEPAKSSGNSGGSKLGMSGLTGIGNQKSSSQTISSAGSRGVNPDRDAKGGPNKGLVIVTVTPAEVDAFRRGIAG